jgi:hypothetical protein
VIGGVGGALIGNSISRGGGGAVIGGLGGAVLGHEIAGSGCNRSRQSADYSNGPRYRSGYRYARAAQPQAVRYVYYDQYGAVVSQGPAPGMATYAAAPRDCHTEFQAYYDERGALAQRPVQTCTR